LFVVVWLADSASAATGATVLNRPFDPSQFALGSNTGNEQQVADDFALGSGNSVGHIEWWGAITGNLQTETQSTRAFILRFFTDSAGLPLSPAFAEQHIVATVFDTGVNSTNSNFAGQRIFGYSSDITPVALNGNQTYWLSILNDDKAPLTQWIWYASTFSPGASVQRRDGDTGAWITTAESSRNVMGFSLTAVPEPEVLTLLGTLAPFVSRRSIRRSARR
jgi:hypothetical protein